MICKTLHGLQSCQHQANLAKLDFKIYGMHFSTEGKMIITSFKTSTLYFKGILDKLGAGPHYQVFELHRVEYTFYFKAC